MSLRPQFLVAVAVLVAAPLSTARATLGLRGRVAALAADPSQGGKMTRNSRREALIGLSLEAFGKLPGPIRRDPSGDAEFIDAKGTRWDVKRFDSRWPIERGGFVLDVVVGKVQKELDAGQNVILDPINLRWSHEQQLRRALLGPMRAGRVLWHGDRTLPRARQRPLNIVEMLR